MSKYIDLDLKFIPHPSTMRVNHVVGKAAIFRSLNHILYTRPGERLYKPDFGIGIQNQLFEQNDFIGLDSLKTDIKDQIKNYEDRITIKNIDIWNDLYNLELKITFYINTEPSNEITFEKTVKQIR
jgi:phage baseplate assembly protein W